MNHYKKRYEELELSLFQTNQIQHKEHPNIIVMPHFVRDDGVVVLSLELKQNKNYLKMISEEMVHISMEILQTKNACVYTIELTQSI